MIKRNDGYKLDGVADEYYLPDSGYFDIDLTTQQSREHSFYLLQHISYIMTTHDVAFLVKDEGTLISDGGFNFAFNSNGFITKEELWTPTIGIWHYTSDFYNKIGEHQADWKEAWKFSARLYDETFNSYIKSLFTGVSDYLSQGYIAFLRVTLPLPNLINLET
ncbi:hypothetical protein LCGC14_0563690 [marine sediment metagenome]|uniref:Uncharacterized protein n=1 Tax=marine sediment metagenome TaxID=412755 RepID=A0A0F9UUJ8_9ZZZZ|nr:MAG: hypothetical protein Lokiarch_04440 [Candidatus Lokiarchaeum sp. GC14_75]